MALKKGPFHSGIENRPSAQDYRAHFQLLFADPPGSVEPLAEPVLLSVPGIKKPELDSLPHLEMRTPAERPHLNFAAAKPGKAPARQDGMSLYYTESLPYNLHVNH